ncbi:MAG: TonB family protein [Rhodothermales bacterium]|nr:TonB family protein [Rhodothermales bacterium]
MLCDDFTSPSTPEIVHRVEPIYPERLKRAGVVGRVVVRVLVDTVGDVQDVQVLRSDDNRLDAYVLEAVGQWTFRPARWEGGKLVAAWTTVPLWFRTDDTLRQERARDSLACVVACRAWPPASSKSSEFIADPLGPRRVSGSDPIYPEELRAAGTEGRVVLRVRVGQHGDVLNANVIRSDHPAFIRPGLDAVQTWTFEMPPCSCGSVQMTIPVRFRP